MQSNPTFCRLSVLAPRSRVDLALPADVPLAELVPMVLELIGEPARSGPGRHPVPWRLSGPAGGPLPPDASLAQLGILDGELLRIGPDVPPPPAPVFDDPADALAATAAAHTGAGPSRGRGLGPAAVVVLAGVSGLMLAGIRTSAAGPWLVALAVVVGAFAAVAAVLHAARLSEADTPDRLGALTAVLAAVPLAAAAGWATLPGPPGPSHLLLAAVATGTVAAVGQLAVRVVTPLLVGLVVVAVAAGLGALALRWTGAAAGAVGSGVAAAALAIGPLLPGCALRLAAIPRPQVPTDARELVAADRGVELVPPAEFAERAELARGYLAGLVGGGAAAVAVGAWLAGGVPGWVGPAFAATAAAALLLRSRGFADPAPARALQLGGAAAALGALAPVALTTGPGVRGAVGFALLAAAAGTATIVSRAERAWSPVTRRAMDLLEVGLVVIAIPLAVGAAGLYGLVRGW
ncbi:type VII secretion integral membrane protein EccD [Pseudonocardia hispaniensis]|uniref:Type VII secretion integral membrane protein EccD n=1 Tax=Pseudonocardia hispaniensis TaxID=904933 RepID=A0ABW1IWF8_9PSEU